MDVLGRRLVSLPLIPGLGLLAFLGIIFLVLAWHRRALGRPFVVMFAATLGATGLAWIGQLVLGLVRSGDYWRGHPTVTTSAVYASALTAALILLLLFARHSDRTRLRAAYWLYFLVAGAAISLVAPGGAIFFLFPPLLFLLGLLASRWHKAGEAVGAIAAAVLVFLTFGPALALFEELMNSGPHWMFAPLGLLILLPFLIELMPLARRSSAPFVVAAPAALFFLGWLAVLLAPAYSDDRKQIFAIEYVGDGEQPRWSVNNDGVQVPFAADWRREKVAWSGRRRWLAPAPTLPVAAPTMELVSQAPAGRGRRLTMRLRTGGAETVTLVAPPEAALIEGGSGGFSGRFADATGPEARYFLRCVGRACDGALFHVVAANTASIDFTLIATRSGLPPEAAPLIAARPPYAQPQYAPDSTLTLTRFTAEGVIGRGSAPEGR
jgi:hypothetical protein